eukprot:15469505-Alexandrium_andersonii.AAC.1
MSDLYARSRCGLLETRAIAGQYEHDAAISIMPPLVDVFGKEARFERAKAIKISATGTLACGEFWARAATAATAVAEESRRA